MVGNKFNTAIPDVIAIDDTLLRDGSCPIQGNCDFENGPCTWQNNAVGSVASGIAPAEMEWYIGSGSDSVATSPASDHTFGNSMGQCLIFDQSNFMLKCKF